MSFISPSLTTSEHEIEYFIFTSRYEDAEDILRTTLDMVTKMAKQNDEPLSARWEPLLNNLGHACRKNKKYDEALKYHNQVRPTATSPIDSFQNLTIKFPPCRRWC